MKVVIHTLQLSMLQKKYFITGVYTESRNSEGSYCIYDLSRHLGFKIFKLTDLVNNISTI